MQALIRSNIWLMLQVSMKIKFLKSAASVRFSYKKGEEYNLPLLEAESFIRSGLAVSVEPVKSVIEQHKITYENAIQNSNSTIGVPDKPDGSEVTLKSNVKRRRKSDNGTDKKRNRPSRKLSA